MKPGRSQVAIGLLALGAIGLVWLAWQHAGLRLAAAGLLALCGSGA